MIEIVMMIVDPSKWKLKEKEENLISSGLPSMMVDDRVSVAVESDKMY